MGRCSTLYSPTWLGRTLTGVVFATGSPAFSGSFPLPSQTSTTGAKIVAHARIQLGWGTLYDPSYVRLTYPGGDVPKNRGVCTDVVVRALRAVGKDLQVLVFQDRKARSLKTDRNIDHRRCPNLANYFGRKGRALTKRVERSTLPQWQPGDIVFWKLDNGRDHVGIITDRRDADGVPHAIHNLSTTLEEPVLRRWRIVGHYRYP